MSTMPKITELFDIRDENSFRDFALKVFLFQSENNKVYAEFIKGINVNPRNVKQLKDIPFLPIEFFKSHKVATGQFVPELVFESSGTTGAKKSKHYVKKASIYNSVLVNNFTRFYGDLRNYCILGLLPSYSERKNSSLVYMVRRLMKVSGDPDCGFFMNNQKALREHILRVLNNGKKIILIGVTLALLDFVEQGEIANENLIVIETGGMKGRREELIREDLHLQLKSGLGLTEIHSEYGMTELLSQAYSKSEGHFYCPPWMRVLIRESTDPKCFIGTGRTGLITVIDLANIYSCSFIATQDVGKLQANGSFDVLGRFDNSEVRGCNLMYLT